jgi:hypothetical protein
MAKKKPARKMSQSTQKIRQKRPTMRKPGTRNRARSSAGSSAVRVPQEWRDGSIVLGKPPAKSLKGRGAERVLATDIRDTEDHPIPRKTCEWFVRKLDPAHKTLAREGDSYEARKVPHLSPEAAALLREKSAAWIQLANSERDAVRERSQASLDTLATIAIPAEFQEGRVILPAPQQPVAKAHCWKRDFAKEVYQAVLHYYGYLPAAHVGSIIDPNGYPAKAMSPEAARLYRANRVFWEAKYAESKSRSKAASSVRKKAADARVEKAAQSAGLSRAELEAKFDRLGMLVEQGNLQLVADMIAGFGDPWLYESLLAGSIVAPNGELKPGRILKRFKERANVMLMLALAAMPDGIAIDATLRRDAAVVLDVAADTVDIVAGIATHLPKLKVRFEHDAFGDLRELPPQTATLISSCPEDLWLSVGKLGVEAASNLASHEGLLRLENLRKIDPEVAAALARHKGALEIGLVDLPEPVAASLSRHCGVLELPNLKTISAPSAAALEHHSGTLTLGNWDVNFTLDARAAQHLGRHAGPVSLPGVRRLDAQAALALSAQSHGIDMSNITTLPAGNAGTQLCKRMAASFLDSYLTLSLPALSEDCAAALSAYRGRLNLSVKTWTDAALIALAAHRGELEINPSRLSAAAAAALARRGASTGLTLSEFQTLHLSDEAAESLRAYAGELAFAGDVEMSAEAARHLAQRECLILFRSKLKHSIRKIFESAGSWKDSSWTRRARLPKAAVGKPRNGEKAARKPRASN